MNSNIGVITDESIGFKSKKMVNPRVRYGARGLIFNEKGEVAILFKEFKNEYKLVGGGCEEGEDYEHAFLREALEETGYNIQIDEFLGNIVEEKSLDDFRQISYVFVAHTLDKVSEPNYTDKERGEGSVLLWKSIDEALGLVSSSFDKLLPSKYDGEKSVYHTKFIIKRDVAIIEYYIRYAKMNNNMKN